MTYYIQKLGDGLKIEHIKSKSIISIRKKAIELLLSDSKTKISSFKDHIGDYRVIFKDGHVVGLVTLAGTLKHNVFLWSKGRSSEYWICNRDGTLGKKVD